MKYCTNCVMPDSKPGIVLDERGWCNACRASETKKTIDWDQRWKDLKKITDEVKSQNKSFYDCIVPVSGGKDSWYQAMIMAEKFNLKILCVTLAAHIPTTEGIHNMNQMVKDLNIDIIKITLKPSVYRQVRSKCFVRQGEPNWAEHCAMFSSVVNTALLYDVPLVVWGEDIAFEFGGLQRQTSTADAIKIDKSDLIKDKTIHNWLDDDISPRDIFFYEYPDYERLNSAGIKSIYLGHFIPWYGRRHYDEVVKRGFKARQAGPLSGNYLDYDNMDEKLCEINIWFKYLKFGFWRSTDQCCYDIWNGNMKRKEAVQIVNKLRDEFPQEYFEDFLRFHDVTEEEFWEVAERNRNHDLWEKVDGKWELKYPVS